MNGKVAWEFRLIVSRKGHMKKLCVALLLVLLLPALTWGQMPASAVVTSGDPFVKRPVTQEEFARAIETDDQSVLNVSCDMMVMTATRVFDYLKVTDCAGLASYVRRLAVRPLPSKTVTTLARVVDGWIDITDFKRELRFGEMGLFDNQQARWVASLSCGNWINDPNLRVYTAMQEASPRDAEQAQALEKTAAQVSAIEKAVEEATSRLGEVEKLAAAGVQSRSQPATSEQGGQGNRAKSGKGWVKPLIISAVVGAVVGVTCVTVWCKSQDTKNINTNLLIVP